jgi:hypothetical protein
MDLEWKEFALEISSLSGETTTKMARMKPLNTTKCNFSDANRRRQSYFDAIMGKDISPNKVYFSFIRWER